MTKAIVVNETGGPDVLSWQDIDVGQPGPTQVRLRHTAIGLNFIDTYFRSGLYKAPNGLPFVPGNEGAGVVEAVGSDVTDLAVGDRVAYTGALGAYAEERLIEAGQLVKIPDAIPEKTAAAMMLKGMTARYLLRRTYPVTADTKILFHAAAGGVGLIAGQWAKHLGATIIGTVGSEEKADIARANGYTHVINYRTENFVDRVKELTDGEGVDVAYDSVGRDTYPGTLDCIRPLGLWAPFGQSSGPITDFDLQLLSQKGSLFCTRPTLFTYIAKRADLEETANDLFDVVASGAVTIQVNQEYPLQDAARAHSDLENRRTTGTTVLLP
ncbi:quinone oxidoreductase family protein [Amorphus orientalis]|uniref:NADPH2:quinone reductase n=1 Tax=Amorphus orientalis TaxID=649198 RepID=A0AAE3VQD1_9HYPH|nr:quinone oxidoreductase [Amorphus orientalis]MDQ0315925.1 NADPH2:quinone reductase [Amorphus orientalis]